jgi:hypothetical protein
MGTILVTAIFWPGGAPRSVAAIDEVTGSDLLVWQAYEEERHILRIGHRGGEKAVELRVA